MVSDAEKYKAEDDKQRERVSSKNDLEAYAFQVKSLYVRKVFICKFLSTPNKVFSLLNFVQKLKKIILFDTLICFQKVSLQTIFYIETGLPLTWKNLEFLKF